MRYRAVLFLAAVAALSYSFATPGRAASAIPAGAPEYHDSIVVRWDNALLQAIRDTKPGPTVVARDLAIVHTAMYDAWATYDAVAHGTRLGGALRHPASERTEANKAEAISYAAFAALVDLFPQTAEVAKFAALMVSLGYDPGYSLQDASTPAGTGNICAEALLQFRHHDGSNQLGDLHAGAYSDYTGYKPVNDPDHIVNPNHWQPLRIPDGKGGFAIQKYFTPQWGGVTPFALKSGSQFRMPGAPFAFISTRLTGRDTERSTIAYIDQARQIVDISSNLTDEQKMIAEYWADGPASELPPGHWCLVAQYVSRRDQHTLDDDVKMFFAVSNAVFDAGIAAWDCKRAFDYARPITAIHYLYKGKWIRAWGGPLKGTQWVRGENWQPYQAPNVVTPSFPECVSGHSTFSGAASEVLKLYTGSDAFGGSVTFPAGSSKFEAGLVPARPVTLSWPTFTDAANQAGISRLYGGIHFSTGDLEGRKVGHKVGAAVWQKAQALFNGTE
ncbi:MAG TPA: vanadium-dependent haloperoxidase [Armatimonadota bacterium]|jgi:hypothetical protein